MKLIRLKSLLAAGTALGLITREKITAPAIFYRGRARVQDVAYPYRMPAGFAGDVNRTHPCTIEPCAIDPDNPPTFFGEAVVLDATSHKVRKVAAGDSGLTDIYGVTVRPFPFQQQSGSDYGAVAIGNSAPSTMQPVDVLRSGYIMVPVNNDASPVKGGAVFVWCAASAGANVQGAFNIVDDGSNSFAITGNDKTSFQGPVDTNGVTELAFNI